MTVEAHRTAFEKDWRFLGLRKKEVERTRVMEYRIAEHIIDEDLEFGGQSPDSLLLLDSPDENNGLYRFVRAVSEDAVVLFDRALTLEAMKNNGTEPINQRLLSKDEINRGGIISEDGLIRISWRETQPGDYPETTVFENIPGRGNVEVPFHSSI
jgi:hypothetical protein